MHDTSFWSMNKMVATYLNENESLTILDIGSLDTRTIDPSDQYCYNPGATGVVMGGSYRPLFSKPNWKYKVWICKQGPT